MEYSLGMDVGHPVYYLFYHDLDLVLVHLVVFTRDELLEVLVVEIEDNLEGLLFGLVKYLEERDDVGVVLESLEERYFSQCA